MPPCLPVICLRVCSDKVGSLVGLSGRFSGIALLACATFSVSRGVQYSASKKKYQTKRPKETRRESYGMGYFVHNTSDLLLMSSCHCRRQRPTTRLLSAGAPLHERNPSCPTAPPMDDKVSVSAIGSCGRQQPCLRFIGYSYHSPCLPSLLCVLRNQPSPAPTR